MVKKISWVIIISFLGNIITPAYSLAPQSNVHPIIQDERDSSSFQGKVSERYAAELAEQAVGLGLQSPQAKQDFVAKNLPENQTSSESNPFEMARKQILNLAKIIEVDPVLLYGFEEIFVGLLNSQLVSVRVIKIRMDDGIGKEFLGYRVLDDDSRGPGKGGIRWDMGVSEDEVRALSKWMSLKCGVIGIPYGGGKGGIICDPAKLSDGEKERLMRAYTRALAPNFEDAVIGPLKDIPAPDMGTNAAIMDYMRDEYENITHDSMSKGIVTGKPEAKGGSLGRTKATGQGVFFSTVAMLELIGEKIGLSKSIEGRSVVIEGFGNVGSHTAKIFHDAKAKVIAVSERTGILYNKNGIDISALNEYFTKNKTFGGFSGADSITINEFWALETDILIPAFKENRITKENAGLIKARMIVEAANGPTTLEADEILRQKGIVVVPDILANAGGVVVSYFEWLQNLEEEEWTLVAVDKMLEERMRIATTSVLETAKRYDVSLRKAAGIIAVIRIINARLAKHPELKALFVNGRKPYKGYGESLFLPETIEELNEMTTSGKMPELIEKVEEEKDAEIDGILGQALNKIGINQRGFILVGGPVTSGKLGLSVSLVEKLRERNRNAIRVNFDAMSADDIRKLNAGEEVIVRDWIAGNTIERKIKLEIGDILVAEGGRVLSEEVLSAIPEKNRFGIFVNTAPSMKLNNNWPLMSTDLRLLRHILTMNYLNKSECIETIRAWTLDRKVQIDTVYRTWPKADVTFNGYLAYELPILKGYVEPMLKEASKIAAQNNEIDALKVIDRLKRTLDGVIAYEPAEDMPDYSIAQQYIGGRRLYSKIAPQILGSERTYSDEASKESQNRTGKKEEDKIISGINSLTDDLKIAAYKEKLKEKSLAEERNIIIAVEIPDEDAGQKQILMQSIDSLVASYARKGNLGGDGSVKVKVVYGAESNLASRIEKARGEISAPLANTVVIGSEDTLLSSDDFAELRGKAFFACIDFNQAIDIPALINISIDIAFGLYTSEELRARFENININLKSISSRVIKISVIKPVDPNELYNLHKTQIRLIQEQV